MQANPVPKIASPNRGRDKLEENLSTRHLHELTGTASLESVRELTATVNTKASTLGHVGQSLPSLHTHTLSGSIIPWMRDLDTSLGSITVLHMGRCHVADLRGVASLASLEELYRPENEIVPCSPISMLGALKTLDLRCNLIDAQDQLGCLGLCSELDNVALMGDPFVKQLGGGKQEYHALVKASAATVKTIDKEFDMSIDTSAHRPKTAFPTSGNNKRGGSAGSQGKDGSGGGGSGLMEGGRLSFRARHGHGPGQRLPAGQQHRRALRRAPRQCGRDRFISALL